MSSSRSRKPSHPATESLPLPWQLWKEQSHLVKLNLRLAHLKKTLREEKQGSADNKAVRRDDKGGD